MIVRFIEIILQEFNLRSIRSKHNKIKKNILSAAVGGLGFPPG